MNRYVDIALLYAELAVAVFVVVPTVLLSLLCWWLGVDWPVP